jgi:hypothetical protein
LCEECEQQCRVDYGYDTIAACLEMPGVASAGGGKDLPLGQLCGEMVSCVLETGCFENGDLLPCYCGAESTCAAPNGACATEMKWAAEGNDLSAVESRFMDGAYAIGRAATLLDCYYIFCPDQCYAP